jgi:hypothetical protein
MKCAAAIDKRAAAVHALSVMNRGRCSVAESKPNYFGGACVRAFHRAADSYRRLSYLHRPSRLHPAPLASLGQATVCSAINGDIGDDLTR